MIWEHVFELCRRRRNFTSREDEATDCNDENDGGDDSILITFSSMQPSLQFLEQQMFADLQLHEMCSDSGGDARRRRHVLPSLLPSNEAVKAATSILFIIDDLSIVGSVNYSTPMVCCVVIMIGWIAMKRVLRCDVL